MDGIQADKLDEQLNEGLDLQHDSCYFCNGFYGPNFGEPICGTCHDFLYSEDFELIDVLHRPIPTLAHHPVQGSSSIPIEKDDGDSGNDEPSEEAVPPGPGPAPMQPLPNLWGVDGNQDDDESLDEEILAMGGDAAEDAIEQNVAPAPPALAGPSHPPPPEINEKMARRLALLTTPACGQAAAPNGDDLCSKLPPEMWAVIFTKLDATSILMVSKVCRKWKTIVENQIQDSFWEQYAKQHFPLIRPFYTVESWHSVCSDLIDSLPCKACFFEMRSIPHIDVNERSLRQVRLDREIKWLKADHPEGIEATPLDDLNYNWLARVNGPADSPYAGGVFYMNLKIHPEYPLKPPVVRFLTKIFHPNVSRHGDVGIDCIQHNWTLALTFAKVLLSVQSLLTDPCTDAYMEASAANLYRNDRPLFEKVARVWTWKYAMHDMLLH